MKTFTLFIGQRGKPVFAFDCKRTEDRQKNIQRIEKKENSLLKIQATHLYRK